MRWKWELSRTEFCQFLSTSLVIFLLILRVQSGGNTGKREITTIMQTQSTLIENNSTMKSLVGDAVWRQLCDNSGGPCDRGEACVLTAYFFSLIGSTAHMDPSAKKLLFDNVATDPLIYEWHKGRLTRQTQTKGQGK